MLREGVSGGYLPVAATLANERIWNAFLGEYAESKSFFHGHTYGGNALGAAAALATLEIFEKEKTLEQLKDKAALMVELLEPLRDYPNVGDVRQRGLIAAIEWWRTSVTRLPMRGLNAVAGKSVIEPSNEVFGFVHWVTSFL